MIRIGAELACSRRPGFGQCLINRERPILNRAAEGPGLPEIVNELDTQLDALLGDGDRSPIVPEVVNEGLTLENTGFGAGEGELPRTREVERAAGWLTVVGKLTEDNGFAGFQSAVRVEVIDVD